MEKTVSVSKGVFVFKNGFKSAKRGKKGVRKKITTCSSGNIFADELWYQSYNTLWNNIEKNIQSLNEEMFSGVLADLVLFIKTCHNGTPREIPTGALLTGINMPDHGTQFFALAQEVKRHVTPHVAILTSQDCPSLKSLVENMFRQILNDEEDSSEDEEDLQTLTKPKFKKSQCSFKLLQSWYEDEYSNAPRKNLVLIMPDFEGFSETVLQSFIQILSSYLPAIPFVLVFGIATSLSSLHRSLHYDVSSKMNVHVFKSQPSTIYLNNVLENVFFTQDCPFHLGGTLFALFTDVFLFYDFSVTGFIQNFKYAMLEHYSTGNAMALCTNPDNARKILNKFGHSDLESVRSLYSFRRLVESETFENRIKLLEDDEYFRGVIEEKLCEIYEYLRIMHVLLKCLKVLVTDLPKTPLGKQIREFYYIATSKRIAKTPEFKEAFQLLNFQSKNELTSKLEQVCEVLQKEEEDNANLKAMVNDLIDLLYELDKVGKNSEEDELMLQEDDSDDKMENLNRTQLKQRLLSKTKQKNTLNKYEVVRNKIINCVTGLFEGLKEPTDFAFHEIFFFDDVSIQNNVIGSHRAAIHKALNDPVSYLQCKCCDIPNESAILSTMPDICIAYKLHLEYGKMINLYDWLQAFLSILDPVEANDDDRKREVDPKLQARFTQCVAEMEFLGFIKSSKRKTDHVSRLTWGG